MQLHPILKWAGSKRALAETVRRTFDAPAQQYLEPCVGAACVYAQRLSVGDLAPGPHVVLADLNAALVAFYRALATTPEALIEALGALPWGEGWLPAYEGNRATYNEGLPQVGPTCTLSPEFAALFLWINRASFNGLYRVSAGGKYNTPAADYRTLARPTAALVRSWSQALAGVQLVCAPFATTLGAAGHGVQVYIDPPYLGMFDAYTTSAWGYDEQARLALAASDARARGAHVVASNADHPQVRALWAGLGFTVREASVYHSVGAQAARRKRAGEVLLVGTPPRRRVA